MDSFIVNGPCKLSGEVSVSSAKNAVLPILAGVLLCEKEVRIKKLPKLRDITTVTRLLEDMGVSIKAENEEFSFFTPANIKTEASYELVKKMRASILVLGPLLSRFKKAKVSLPGGCAIGTRPIDIHLRGLEKMGADITVEKGYVEATTKGLVGAHIVLPFPSVGATENLVMAAVFAEGETIIENAAKEPEIDDLCHFLQTCFPLLKIKGIGSDTIKIQGVSHKTSNESVSYQAIADRIEAATFIIAGLITRSDITVKDFEPTHIDSVITFLKNMGAKIDVSKSSVKVEGSQSKFQGINIDTAPYPGFPTDVQAQMMSLLCTIDDTSIVTENIFENRFMHVSELARMGAEIDLKGKSAIVKGGKPLTGAPVMCTDLRASAALVLAALHSKGETKIQRVYHIDRGYEGIDKKLQSLGANIQRVHEEMF